MNLNVIWTVFLIKWAIANVRYFQINVKMDGCLIHQFTWEKWGWRKQYGRQKINKMEIWWVVSELAYFEKFTLSSWDIFLIPSPWEMGNKSHPSAKSYFSKIFKFRWKFNQRNLIAVKGQGAGKYELSQHFVIIRKLSRIWIENRISTNPW